MNYEEYDKYIKNIWGNPNKTILHGYHYINQLKLELEGKKINKTWKYNNETKKLYIYKYIT